MNAPNTETIRFIGRILGARTTPPAELASVITAITEGFSAIRSGPRQPSAVALVAPEPEPPVTAVETRPKRPRRPRVPRKVEAPAPLPIEPTPEPVQPRLLRRAQVAPAEPVVAAPAPLRAKQGTVRGVVKWFDSKARKGAIRLTGISGDVPLDPLLLERAGIRRLYKDQEIEAAIEGPSDRIRLVDLFLPARAPSAGLPGALGGLARRAPRQVTVEVKRNGIRSQQARAEAEQVLGAKGTVRLPRRVPPT